MEKANNELLKATIAYEIYDIHPSAGRVTLQLLVQTSRSVQMILFGDLHWGETLRLE